MDTTLKERVDADALAAPRFRHPCEHIEGPAIYFDRLTQDLAVFSGEVGTKAVIEFPIGPVGMIELGCELIALGHQIKAGV